jgi:flagellar hook-length control protein FliK
LDKPIKSAEKEMKIKATPGQPERAQARPAVAENAVRPASQESIKAGGKEVKLHPAAVKKADKATVTRDSAGELNQLPGLHNMPVSLERPGADKPVMSKSQIDLIANHLAGQINSGSSSLEVDLQPEALGKIKLMFQMEDGSLTVRIIAHTEEAHHLLDASLQSMKENLSQQGIKISDMSLDLANQEKQGNQTGSGHKEAGRPAKMFGDQKESYENTGIWEQTSTQYSRLNILA